MAENEDRTTAAIEAYLSSLERIPPTTSEEYSQLVEALRSGDIDSERDARTRLHQSQVPLVLRIARLWQHQTHVGLLELIQAGDTALAEAVPRFVPTDHDDGTGFRAFVEPRISEAIQSRGEDGPFGRESGDREPRNPPPSTDSGSAAVDRP